MNNNGENEMKVTDEVVEAAAEAIKNGMPFIHFETARAVLNAAMPYIRDQVLEEAAQEFEQWGDIYGNNAARFVRSLANNVTHRGGRDG